MAQLYAPVVGPLTDVEKRFSRELQSPYESLMPVLRHGTQLGGKRLRPAMLLLAGSAVGELTDDLRKKYEKKGLQGVVVVDVIEDSPAKGAGIDKGDVILSVNRRPVKSVNEYRQLIAKTTAQKGVLLRVLDGESGYVRFQYIKTR